MLDSMGRSRTYKNARFCCILMDYELPKSFKNHTKIVVFAEFGYFLSMGNRAHNLLTTLSPPPKEQKNITESRLILVHFGALVSFSRQSITSN